MSKCLINSIGVNSLGQFGVKLSFGFMSLWVSLVDATDIDYDFDEYIYSDKLHIGSLYSISGEYPNRIVIVNSKKVKYTFKETRHSFEKYYNLDDIKRYILIYKNIDLLNYSNCSISKKLYYDSVEAYKYIMFAIEINEFATYIVTKFLSNNNLYVTMFDDNAYVNHNLTWEEFNDIRQWKSRH